MAVEFQMPKLGLTMEEGKISEWLVPEGGIAVAGEAVLVIETDKVETEVTASTGGRLHQLGAVGDSFRCGERIGWILAEGEEPPDGPAVGRGNGSSAAAPSAAEAAAPPASGGAAPDRAAGSRLLASPNARRVAAELGVDIARVRGTGPGGRIVSEDVEQAAAAGAAPAPSQETPAPTTARAEHTRAPSGAAPVATVAARQLADLLGVDLAGVDALAPDGRVSRDDVAAHVRQRLSAPSAAAARSSAAPAALLQEPSSVVPMRGMRGTIASRMHASLQQMAQLTLTMDVDMDAVVEDRDARKAGGDAPGYTDYVILAAARALRDHPVVNSQITEDGVALLPQINVGMAVALEQGLIVPVIAGTDRLSLDFLSRETKRLAEAARTSTLTLPELEGGTFSVSTLGMFGVDAFTPVINPPNTAILGIGRLRDDVAFSAKGKAKRASRLTLSLTWDHRAFDGAPAAQFTQTIKRYLEDPIRLT